GRAAPGTVRARRTGEVVRTVSRSGAALTVVIVTALAAFPFVFKANWVVNIAVFTMMYAGLATAWNLLGGYSGYISLCNAAFFGIGAYTIANLFPTSGGPPGSTPFLILPFVGLGVAIVSLPVGWVAFRTRGVTFAIDPLITIGMVLMVFLGGKGTLWGPLLGALLLVPAQRLLAQNAATARWYLVLYSGVFLLVILLLPRGIIPSVQDLVARLRSKGDREASPPAAATSPVPTGVVR